MTDVKSSVVDNTAQQRFELLENGYLAFASYRPVPGGLVIPHVEAAELLRGTGAAGRLMTGVVAHARDRGLHITPMCSYAVSWFRRHPDAADVVK